MKWELCGNFTFFLVTQVVWRSKDEGRIVACVVFRLWLAAWYVLETDLCSCNSASDSRWQTCQNTNIERENSVFKGPILCRVHSLMLPKSSVSGLMHSEKRKQSILYFWKHVLKLSKLPHVMSLRALAEPILNEHFFVLAAVTSFLIIFNVRIQDFFDFIILHFILLFSRLNFKVGVLPHWPTTHDSPLIVVSPRMWHA